MKKILVIILGCTISSFGLNAFLIPNNIATGGFSGIAILINSVANIPVGIALAVLNVPIFIIAFKKEGKEFVLFSLFATFLYSVLIDSMGFIGAFSSDPVLCSVYGGLCAGIGYGIILKYGATTGGTDLLSRIIATEFKTYPMGRIMFTIDAIVIFASIILIGLDRGLYAIISVFISSMIIDLLIKGISRTKAFHIITSHPEEVAKVIMQTLERGVTKLKCEGAYSGEKKTVLICAVNDRSEIVRMKELIKKYDENAFVLVSEVAEVLGEGFYDTY